MRSSTMLCVFIGDIISLTPFAILGNELGVLLSILGFGFALMLGLLLEEKEVQD